jgi:hypothetical protein
MTPGVYSIYRIWKYFYRIERDIYNWVFTLKEPMFI